MPNNIGSSTATITLEIPDLLDQQIIVEGWSATDMFGSGPVTSIETSMGLGGRLSRGWVPVERTFTINLQADSPTNDIFEQLEASQRTRRQAFRIDGVVTIESIQKSYNLVNGCLVTLNPVADAKKTLEPRRYEFKFEDITPAPIGVG